MPDRLELELIRRGSIPLTPLGLLKMRPDLVSSTSQAAKMLQRSRVRNPDKLMALPVVSRSGLVVVEFEAENAGRTHTHRHLFMIPNQHAERHSEPSPYSISAGRIPFAAWVEYLKRGDPEIAGSGWLGVQRPRLLWS